MQLNDHVNAGELENEGSRRILICTTKLIKVLLSKTEYRMKS